MSYIFIQIFLCVLVDNGFEPCIMQIMETRRATHEAPSPVHHLEPNEGTTMKTYITLNINLNASKHLPEGAELHLQSAEDYIQKSLGEPIFIGVSRGETGRTIVMQYKYVEFVLPRLYSLARDLKLDYIAYSIQEDDDTVLGVIGEYAHEYNDEFVVASTNLFGCSGTPLQPDTQGTE